MLKVNDTVKPKNEILDALAAFQKEIDDLPTFEDKRKKAKQLFATRNKKGNKIFDAIKVALLATSPGIERCAYCEDSKCDEAEHIYPKDFYPQFCFLWINFLYVCGICNGGKNNKFAIFRHDNGQFHVVNPASRKAKAVEPPSGDMVLINPRVDDPFDFCELDLETFVFSITSPAHTKDYLRADYTFNTVLQLNEQREYLREQRELAYGNFKARLHSYTINKKEGAKQEKLDRIIDNFKRESHPTVWKEMQRQYKMGLVQKIDEELNNLFIESPEALNW